MYRCLCNTRVLFRARQAWKDVSTQARDFIDKLLVVDASVRLTAAQALKHPWMTTTTTSNSRLMRRTCSKNLMERQSTRSSDKSTRSSRSNRSAHSLRSEHRRVGPEEIDALHRDPEFQAELSSLSGTSQR